MTRRGALDVTVHIGSGKTGTSSVQAFLGRNRGALADAGCLYPRAPGKARHVRIGFYVRSSDDLVRQPSWPRQKFEDPDRFRAELRRALSAEITSSGLSHVLLSDEALYGLPLSALRRLGRLGRVTTRRLRAVVYLRRQDDHLVSGYQQRIKVGEVERLSAWAERDHAATYDYRARLSTWQRAVEPDDLVVRRFERDRFVEGSLLHDFADACSLDLPWDSLEIPQTANESLDAESVEFLRLLNLHHRDHRRLAAAGPDNRRIVRRLAAHRTGPTLTLPQKTLETFMSRWRDGNRELAQEVLGDPGGELFDLRPQRRPTTVEQRLDPDRFDQLFTVTRLPESLREPLRARTRSEAALR